MWNTVHLFFVGAYQMHYYHRATKAYQASTAMAVFLFILLHCLIHCDHYFSTRWSMLTIVMQICVFFLFESCVPNIPGTIYPISISVALCMSWSLQWMWYSFIKDEGQDQYQTALPPPSPLPPTSFPPPTSSPPHTTTLPESPRWKQWVLHL